MRIAQVAPLTEPVPPFTYGGTERVVAYLTDALVDLGHDVTLIASGDSQTRARLMPASDRALRLDPDCRDELMHHIRQVELVADAAHSFDLIHFHTGFLHMPVARRLRTPSLTTLHGRLDVPDLVPLMRTLKDVPLASISEAQRLPLPDLCWYGTVHNAIPADLHPYSATPGDYVAFVGRISPEKRVDRAIEIARLAGLPLKIAAKVDAVDRTYYEEVVTPLLRLPGVEFLGEIDDRAKATLLGGARALLFPIDWPEPFGMVVIEALACGTPVVAWRHGSVPELLEHGRTGWIVDSIEGAVDGLASIDEIDRRQCRAVFERRFTADLMARAYVAIYEKLLGRSNHSRLEVLSA
jgi:glycosyltransferase involved in cell wall biosynthesis